MEDISYATVIPGRLQHVKCRLESKALEISNSYQYTLNPTQTRTDPQKFRRIFWQKLDQLMHQMAHRNVLVLGGDFNCPLTGHGTPPAVMPPDAFDFQNLIKKYHMGTVRAHDGGPTYIGSQGASTIDFVFLRPAQLDYPARQGKRLTNVPLACWREQPDHFPILCSISLGWTRWHAKKPRAHMLNRLTQEHMFQAWKQHAPSWQHLEESLRSQMQDLPQHEHCFQDFTSNAISQSSDVFRAPSSHTREDPHRTMVGDIWTHFRALHRPVHYHAPCFQCVVPPCPDSKAQKIAKSCKAAKQARLLEAVRQAEIAAANHDTRKLFCIIRSLTPTDPV